MMNKKQKSLAVVGLFICYAGTIFNQLLLKQFFPSENVWVKMFIFGFSQISLCLAILYYVLTVEKKSLASIGFKKFKVSRDIKWGLIGFGLGGLSFAITGPLIAMLDMETTMDGVMKLVTYPIWFRIGVAVIAGTTEELLFRTYPIERLQQWTGNIWIAGLLALVFFAALHIPFWSMGGAIQIGVGTLIWTLIYIKTRSIWAMMIMHVINDLFAFVALPMIFGSMM